MPVAYETRKEIEIQEGVNIKIKNDELTVKGKKGSISRKLYHPRISIKKENGKIMVLCKLPKRKDNALACTWFSHIKNMINGVTEGYEYKMKMVYSHFPMKALIKGNTFIIENFFGERQPRIANIIGQTKISIKGSEVILKGINKEDVGQSAANIELATKIKNFDPRVFQDGIYIIKKG